MLTTEKREQVIRALINATRPPQGRPGDYVRLDAEAWDEIIELLVQRQQKE